MAWLLDTNIVSEMRKGRSAHANVLAWAAAIRHERQFISVLSLGELQKGIHQLRLKDPTQAQNLGKWLAQVKERYADNTIPVCSQVAERWGELNAMRSFPVMDGLLAATAWVHHLRVATRNAADFKGSGVDVLNPFVWEA